MPLKSGKCTPREEKAARAFARTGDLEYSQRMGGYKTPAGAKQALSKPAMVEVIRREQELRLTSSLLPLALDTLEKVMQDEKASAAARVTAARVVVTQGLQRGADTTGANASEMTAGELAEAMARIRREIAERRAAVIDVTPDSVDVLG